MRYSWFWILAALLLGSLCSPAREAAHTQVELRLQDVSAKPAERVETTLRMAIPPGWHTYWRNPGDAGGATEIHWSLPEGWTADALEWPIPEKLDQEGLVTFVYQGDTFLRTFLHVASNAPPGRYPLKAQIQWLECNDKSCLPQSQNWSGEIQVLSPTERAEPRSNPASSELNPRNHFPKEDPALAPKAYWISRDEGRERKVAVEWTPPAGASGWDFFPYESKGLSVRATNELVEVSGGRVKVVKTVDISESSKSPTTLAGLVVFRPNANQEPVGIQVQTMIEAEPPKQLASAASTSLTLPPQTASVNPGAPSEPKSTSYWIRQLFYAFVGGLILNIMPCVLPVISLKILGFVNQSGSDLRKVRQLGFVYALGVWFSFLILAGAVIGMKQLGKAVSWGIQFGNPQFLVVVTSLVTLVALNLFGLFEVTLNSAASDSAGELARKEGAAGAFFNGILAVILATPCTAPYLGSSIGFAITQPPSAIIAFFSMVALGLASPYIVLSWRSEWLKWLPKPGAWMERFKIAMGFPMLGAAMWLFSVTWKHFGERSLWFGFFLILLSAAAWVFGQFIQKGTRRPVLAWGVFFGLLGIAYGKCLETEVDWRRSSPARTAATLPANNGTSSGGEIENRAGIAWKPWSPAAVAEARASGKPVLVDFTADWCVTCNVNRRTSIEIPQVIAKLKELDAVAFLADYTATPDDITEELGRWGRAGVPLVVVYPKSPSLPGQALPELLTPKLMLDALEKAAR